MLVEFNTRCHGVDMHPFSYLQHGEESIEWRTDLTTWVSFLVSSTGSNLQREQSNYGALSQLCHRSTGGGSMKQRPVLGPWLWRGVKLIGGEGSLSLIAMPFRPRRSTSAVRSIRILRVFQTKLFPRSPYDYRTLRRAHDR